MADSGVPFAIGAANVPLVEDLNDIPVGQTATIEVLMTDLVTGDVPLSMTLTIKRDPNDSDIATTSVVKTITTTLSADGVILPTSDPSVFRAVFQLTRAQATRIANASTYTYSVVATVTRGAVNYLRMIQRGAIAVNLYAIDSVSPLADGTWMADGTLFASGFSS